MEKYWFVHNPVSGNPPKVKHGSYSMAEAEAKRLAAANPGVSFFILETVAAFAAEQPKVIELRLEIPPSAAFDD
jgi:hypothetical protein